MNKVLMYSDLLSYGLLGEKTGFMNLRVGDVINVDGDNCIVVKLNSFYSIMGYVGYPLEDLSMYYKCNYQAVYSYTDITEENIENISGFKFYIKELDANGKIPITIEEAERFIRRRNVKIVY